MNHMKIFTGLTVAAELLNLCILVYFLFRSDFGTVRTSIASDTIIYYYSMCGLAMIMALVVGIKSTLSFKPKLAILLLALIPSVLFLLLNLSGTVCEIKKANKCMPLYPLGEGY